MLEELSATEANLIEEQKLMGDACKELREAHKLTVKAVASALRFYPFEVEQMERKSSMDSAKRYRQGVLIAISTQSP